MTAARLPELIHGAANRPGCRMPRGMRLAALCIVLLLVMQSIAGIVANLYVTIPAAIPGDKPEHSGRVLHDLG